jgi:hypothetical protein
LNFENSLSSVFPKLSFSENSGQNWLIKSTLKAGFYFTPPSKVWPRGMKLTTTGLKLALGVKTLCLLLRSS